MARAVICRSMARQGPARQRSAATAAARPLSNGVPDWTALRSRISATRASGSRGSVVDARAPIFERRAILIVSSRANAASSIDRTSRKSGPPSSTTCEASAMTSDPSSARGPSASSR